MDLERTENLGIEKVLKRGSAQILEQDESGIFVYDTVSGAYMISSEDTEKACRWLMEHEDDGCDLLGVTGKDIAAFAEGRFGFENVMKCRQLAYYGPEQELQMTGMKVRTASPEDLYFILSNYSSLSEEELIKVIGRGKLYIAEPDGKPAGFIGEHLEGSMGILFVLPEYRRRGVASYLEKFLINVTLREGYVPFGQVVEGNEASLALQKKLGMAEGDQPVFWMF